ncbi:MAG TPA: hypothetical protein VIM46_00145 [Luteolibacter sp.]
MNRRTWLAVSLAALWPCAAPAQDDPGKESLGAVVVKVYYATDGDPGAAGGNAKDVPADMVLRLRSESRLKFTHYREIGSDTKTLFRSYENWAQPLGNSDEVLVRFEARNHPSRQAAFLGIELWLSRRKVLRTDAEITTARPLHVLGPAWRGGRLIVSVALEPIALPNPQ